MLELIDGMVYETTYLNDEQTKYVRKCHDTERRTVVSGNAPVSAGSTLVLDLQRQVFTGSEYQSDGSFNQSIRVQVDRESQELIFVEGVAQLEVSFSLPGNYEISFDGENTRIVVIVTEP